MDPVALFTPEIAHKVIEIFRDNADFVVPHCARNTKCILK